MQVFKLVSTFSSVVTSYYPPTSDCLLHTAFWKLLQATADDETTEDLRYQVAAQAPSGNFSSCNGACILFSPLIVLVVTCSPLIARRLLLQCAPHDRF